MRRNGAVSVTLVHPATYLLLITLGRNRLDAETVESHKGVRCCPVRSSTNICDKHRGPTHKRRRHSMSSELSSPGGTARIGTGMPRRRHPLSSGPASAWRQPSFSVDLNNRERAARAVFTGSPPDHENASWEPCARIQAGVSGQCETQQRQGWICLLQGQCLQVHHLITKSRGWNFGHEPWTYGEVIA